MIGERIRKVMLGSALGAACLLCGTTNAFAFCRSTTCEDGKVSCPKDANGCKTTGSPLWWPTVGVGYTVQKDTSIFAPALATVTDLVNSAFQVWGTTQCADGTRPSIVPSFAGLANCRQIEYNPAAPNANVILFQDQGWTYVQETMALAKTTVSFNRQTGEIFDADMEINTAQNLFSFAGEDAPTQNDFLAVITHEAGHFLGLDHSIVGEGTDASATMHPSYNVGQVYQRDLAPDDVAGLCLMYPAARQAAGEWAPPNGFSAECQQEIRARVAGIKPNPKSCAVAPRVWETSMGANGLFVGLTFAVAIIRRSRRSEQS